MANPCKHKTPTAIEYLTSELIGGQDDKKKFKPNKYKRFWLRCLECGEIIKEDKENS